MSPTDGFGLHADFIRRELAHGMHLAPSGLDQLQLEFALPSDIGTGRVVLTQLGAGVGYSTFSCSDAKDETAVRSQLHPGHVIFPFHLLREPVEVGIEGVSQRILLLRTDSYCLGPTTVGTQTIRPGVEIDQVFLYVDVTRIDSCFSDRREALPPVLKRGLTHPEVEPFFLPGRATPAMGLALRQMLTCGLNGSVARLYLEAKVHEIAALRLAQLSEDLGSSKPLNLTRRDIDLLEEARDILLTRFHAPPTIAELAGQVGLNRTKLKAGFKQRFGTTVFGFVRSLRMQYASTLLRDGVCNVTEAAATVGYNSPGAFAVAFKAELGFSPCTIRGCEDLLDGEGSTPAV